MSEQRYEGHKPMNKPIINDSEALKVANRIIQAQEKLLMAYRIGGKTPGVAIDTLGAQKPRLMAYLTTATDAEES